MNGPIDPLFCCVCHEALSDDPVSAEGVHLACIYATGDTVFLTYRRKTVRARVALASSNGRSLVLHFEGVLGGYVGDMPVLDGRDLILGEPVVITSDAQHEADRPTRRSHGGTQET